MKQKGFTLVEILAVLVLISALAILIVPSIINYINESKEEISHVTSELIYSGAKLYVDSKPNEYPKESGNKFCVTLKEVVDANYLTAPILDSVSGNEIDLNKFVKINYVYDDELQMNKFEYEIIDSCKMCILLNDSDNSGTITFGDKYSCNPGDGYKNFYVLETGDNISLIMSENIDKNVVNEREVINSFEQYMANWSDTRIIEKNLPTYEQVTGGKIETVAHVTQAWWLEGYYWTSLIDGISNSRWAVRQNILDYIENDGRTGIRPVITISSDDL
ncbi:MAG: type II secretion system protein [Firmicutes bacterium]|nr:type II secretion system protein [Bacillota bacterium]